MDKQLACGAGEERVSDLLASPRRTQSGSMEPVKPVPAVAVVEGKEAEAPRDRHRQVRREASSVDEEDDRWASLAGDRRGKWLEATARDHHTTAGCFEVPISVCDSSVESSLESSEVGPLLVPGELSLP